MILLPIALVLATVGTVRLIVGRRQRRPERPARAVS